MEVKTNHTGMGALISSFLDCLPWDFPRPGLGWNGRTAGVRDEPRQPLPQSSGRHPAADQTIAAGGLLAVGAVFGSVGTLGAVQVASQLCVDSGHADALIVGLPNEADVSTVSGLMKKAKRQAQEPHAD